MEFCYVKIVYYKKPFCLALFRKLGGMIFIYLCQALSLSQSEYQKREKETTDTTKDFIISDSDSDSARTQFKAVGPG
jgi:hypothetical protein